MPFPTSGEGVQAAEQQQSSNTAVSISQRQSTPVLGTVAIAAIMQRRLSPTAPQRASPCAFPVPPTTSRFSLANEVPAVEQQSSGCSSTAPFNLSQHQSKSVSLSQRQSLPVLSTHTLDLIAIVRTALAGTEPFELPSLSAMSSAKLWLTASALTSPLASGAQGRRQKQPSLHSMKNVSLHSYHLPTNLCLAYQQARLP
ncbi:unnamed protein product [Closterium sp. NIES-53]